MLEVDDGPNEVEPKKPASCQFVDSSVERPRASALILFELSLARYPIGTIMIESNEQSLKCRQIQHSFFFFFSSFF